MSDMAYQGITLTGSLQELEQAVDKALAAGSLSDEERQVWLQAMPELLSQDLPEELEEKVSDLKVNYDL
mgnify:CR=1 FL=1